MTHRTPSERNARALFFLFRNKLLPLVLICMAQALCGVNATYAQEQAPHRHGIAMHGEPVLPVGFATFPYVRADAPKGGKITLGVLGTFDTVNPFIVPGSAAQGINGNVIETLMARSYDEPFTLYGLIAETVATPTDRSYVEFKLNPRARFADGTPVTAEDVRFSWDLLRQYGRPNHRSYYGKVKEVRVLDPQTIRFGLSNTNDRELPLILGLMPVLSHQMTVEGFTKSGFTPLMGSGPYVISHVQPGESVTLTRNPDYWGADLPSRRGTANFDEMKYDYYRDANTMFEAFKKGLYDYREETDPSRWASDYDFPALRDGRVVKEEYPRGVPSGMNGLVFNTRKPLFKDARVRDALGLVFDFEWVNANLFHGLYTRTGSYFDNSELASRGRPADARERTLLAPFGQAVREDILEGRWQPPRTDGSGRDRDKARQALAMLKDAGWTLVDGQLRSTESNEPFTFEILVKTKEHERIALAYSRMLRAVGVNASVRLVDAIQFERRMNTFDFDMAPYFWFASLSPGNEQAFYWGSAAAGVEGTRNYMGVRSPAVDAMIAQLNASNSREEFVSAVRALDRVLLSGFYVVPLYHTPNAWGARWTTVERPERTSVHGPLVETWWRAHNR